MLPTIISIMVLIIVTLEAWREVVDTLPQDCGVVIRGTAEQSFEKTHTIDGVTLRGFA
jgi:hypothetical protein